MVVHKSGTIMLYIIF